MNKQATLEILADPFAPQSRWLAAWKAGGSSLPCRRIMHPASAVALGLFVAGCTSAFAMFGFDWSREILEEIIGTQSFTVEAALAAVINLCLILPVTFGAATGYLQERSEDGYLYNAAASLVLLSCGIVASVAVFRVLPVWTFGFATCGALGMAVSFWLGSLLRESMETRSVCRRLFAPSLFYLLPAGLLFFFHMDDGNFGFREEVIVFLSVVFAASSWAARRVGAKTPAVGATAAMFTLLPVTIISTVNLLTLSALSLASVIGPLGANLTVPFLSTFIFAGATTLFAAAGGAFGTMANLKKSESLSISRN